MKEFWRVQAFHRVSDGFEALDTVKGLLGASIESYIKVSRQLRVSDGSEAFLERFGVFMRALGGL